MVHRRSTLKALAGLGAGALLGGAGLRAMAQTFPSKPVKVVTAFPPGAGPDAVLRIIGDQLARKWAQPIVVENKPGGSGFIAYAAFRQGGSDGHDLIQLDSNHITTHPHTFSKLPYDAERDLAPIAMLLRTPFFVAVAADSPYKSVDDILSAARAKPESINYGSWFNGSPGHIGALQLQALKGVRMTHVAYRDFSERDPLYPAVPATAEIASLKGFEVSAWAGLFGPKTMPESVRGRIASDVAAVPTPHATELVQPLRQALELLRTATRQHVVFDPTTSRRHFKLSMTDVSHLEFLPSLMNRVNTAAPSVHIEVQRITGDTPKLLESAVRPRRGVHAGVGGRLLSAAALRSRLCLRGAQGSPPYRRPHDDGGLQAREACRHHGRRHGPRSRAARAGALRHREARCALASDLPGLGNMLANTDLIATVPERVAQMLARIASVKLLAPPIALPRFAIKQHWHERYHQDPANRWLRSVIADLFLE